LTFVQFIFHEPNQLDIDSWSIELTNNYFSF